MNVKIALILAAVLLPCTFAIRIARVSKSAMLSDDWDYDEQGEDWSSGSCATGVQQSPINIISSNARCSNSDLLQVTLNTSFASEIINNGHSYECEGEASKILWTSSGSSIPFEAAQYHFHAPSEHTIDGRRYDLEVHIVHSVSSDYQYVDTLTRSLAVIGILFEVDERAPAHPFLSAFESHTPGEEFEVNLQQLLPIGDRPQFYSYPGSLTTPPCNETVNWFLLANVQKMPPTQLDYFAFTWSENSTFAGGNGNNREVQPLNGRTTIRGNCF